MRKIEQQMNNAIRNGIAWSNANTCTTFDPTNNMACEVYLHGNHIATVTDSEVILFDGGYQSNTTKSRLNAILSEHGDCGDKVFAKNFDWFVQINTVQGLTTVPFFSSMRLG